MQTSLIKTIIFPLLVCILFSGGSNAEDKSNVVATLKGESITYGMLERGSEMDIYQAKMKAHGIRLNKLKEILITKFIRLDDKSQGLSDQQYVSQFIIKPLNISEELITAFAKRQKIPAEKLDASVRQKIRQFLFDQNYVSQLDAWFNAQTQIHDVVIKLPEPEEPFFEIPVADSPYRGSKDAKITLIEFSDFECPYCAKADLTVKQLIQKYGDNIRVVYKHLPLNFHPNAQKAAEASLCAHEQSTEYFWQLHDMMFESQKNLSIGLLKDKAKSLGLDYDRFSKCLTSGQYSQRVEEDMALGQSLGVSATPAFFVNGRLINGAQPLQVFVERIEKELARR